MGLKRLLILLVLSLGIAYGQSTDIELGVKGQLEGAKAPYAIARFNYRVGPQIFSQDAYAVFETGAMLTGAPSLWLAGEFLLDGEYTTEFLRLEYTETAGIYFKTGVRFGFGQ